MEKIALIFLVIVLIVGGIFFAPGKNSKEEYMIPMRGMDLTGAPRQIPQSLDNNLSVVIFAFKEEQQQIVNQWLPFVTAIQRHNADTEFYQIIFYDISDENTVYWSNDAIRRGILKKDSEDHTITVFMDDDRLLKTLNMTKDTIHTMLIHNRKRQIIWRASGSPTAETQEELNKATHTIR